MTKNNVHWIQHGSCMYKILSKFIHLFWRYWGKKNTFLHESRAIPLLFINEFRPIAIPNHSSPIPMSVQSLKKIGPKLLKLESGNDIFTQIEGRDSVVYERICSFAIPNHSSPISMSMQSLKKFGQKLLKSGNEALTDRRTLKSSKFSEGITK